MRQLTLHITLLGLMKDRIRNLKQRTTRKSFTVKHQLKAILNSLLNHTLRLKSIHLLIPLQHVASVINWSLPIIITDQISVIKTSSNAPSNHFTSNPLRFRRRAVTAQNWLRPEGWRLRHRMAHAVYFLFVTTTRRRLCDGPIPRPEESYRL
jgi:hypothetical protein